MNLLKNFSMSGTENFYKLLFMYLPGRPPRVAKHRFPYSVCKKYTYYVNGVLRHMGVGVWSGRCGRDCKLKC